MKSKCCHDCQKELCVLESRVTFDEDFAVCRDCWVNKIFES
jgi:hypothetical protein